MILVHVLKRSLKLLKCILDMACKNLHFAYMQEQKHISEADRRLWFCFIDSTTPLLDKS